MKTRILAVAFVVAALAVAAAQQPTFRAEINYVELPVRVLDAKGAFVRDLTQSDFQMFEDGARQEIASFGLVDLPAPVSGKAASGTAPAASPPPVLSVDSLQKLDGRLYLFIVDDYHIRPQYSFRAKQLVQTFIKDRMAAKRRGRARVHERHPQSGLHAEPRGVALRARPIQRHV